MKTDELRHELARALREQAPVRPEARARVQRLVRRQRATRLGVTGVVVVAVALGLLSVLRPGSHQDRFITTVPETVTTPMPEQVVAVTADHQLVVLDSATGRVLRRLAGPAVTDTSSNGANAAVAASLTVTPDGHTVYFVSQDRGGTFPNVGSVPVAGGAVTSPFGPACCLHNPAVSPDGRWLAYTGVVNRSDGGGDILLYDLALARPAGSGIYARRWTSTTPLRRGIGPLAWAPDSQHLAFVDNDVAKPTQPRMLDLHAAESTPLDQLPPVPWPGGAMRWAGYRGRTGELLAIAGGAAGRVVTVDPTSGAVTRTLFTLPGAAQLVSDPSGQHLLAETPDGLYRWSVGDRTPRHLAPNIRAAVWVPGADTATALRTQAVDATVVTRGNRGFVALDPKTGRVVRDLPVVSNASSCSMCLSGFRLGDVTVVSDGATVWALPRDGSIRPLGPGRFPFPAADRTSIYVATESSTGTVVDQRDLHGQHLGGPWTVPSGYELSGRDFGYIARAVVDGVLVQTTENNTDHTLAIWNPRTNALRVVGHNRWGVLDTYTTPGASTSTIAWFDTAGCAFPACTLALTDSATGTTRVIRAPDGYTGYFYGGAFSPDGTHLAVFPTMTPAPAPGQPVNTTGVDLGIVDVEARTVSVVANSHLGTGDPAAFAAWTPSSDWVVFTAYDEVKIHRHGTPDAASLPVHFPTATAIALAPR